MKNNPSNRKLTAIMFADIVSYSRMMGANEEETLKLLNDFESISADIIKEYEGVIIKKNGDEIFCEFTSSKNAVDAALKLQKELSKYNDSRPKDFKLEVRIGIHIGDVVKREDGDIHGDGVNVAARIQPLASPGGICVSGAVSDALSSHPNYDVISKGEQELKNILQKHSIFQVKTGYETVEPDGSKAIFGKSKRNYTLYLTLGVVAIIGLFLMYNRSNNDEKALSIMLSRISSVEGEVKDIAIYIHEFTDYVDIPDDIKIELVSEPLRNEIYDELLSYSQMHGFIKDVTIKSTYELEEDYKRKGLANPEFNFNSSTALLKTLFGKSDKSPGEALQQGTEDEHSINNYTINEAQTDFGYFPVIFQFKSPQYKVISGLNKKEVNELVQFKHYDNFLIWHAFCFHRAEGKKSSWNIRGPATIASRDDIIKEMYNNVNSLINQLLAQNKAVIASIDNNEVLLKYDHNVTPALQDRMIYDVSREYTFP